jgi:hypothetical protein
MKTEQKSVVVSLLSFLFSFLQIGIWQCANCNWGMAGVIDIETNMVIKYHHVTTVCKKINYGGSKG